MNTQDRDYRLHDIRLLILQGLTTQPAYTTHEHVLRTGLAAQGHPIGADEARGVLSWLDSAGLIIVNRASVWVATLTLRGQDVADGVADYPGVARPRPER